MIMGHPRSLSNDPDLYLQSQVQFSQVWMGTGWQGSGGLKTGYACIHRSQG